MALSPFLDICLNNCSTIKFVDSTNLYSTSNTGGYGEANAVEGSANVTEALITVYDSDSEVLFEYDVTDQFPVAITGDLIFEEYEYALPDGEFEVVYTITTDLNAVLTYSTYYLNTCNFECCMDQLIATIPSKICANRCDTDYIDEVLTIEGLLYGYMCASQCDKPTIKAEIEKRLERFCDFQCNCN